MRRAGTMAAVLMVLCTPVLPCRSAPLQPLQLEVTLNGRPTGLVSEFLQMPDGRLAATPADLSELGVRSSSALANEPVPLDTLAGLSYFYDPAEQRILISAPDATLIPNKFDASGAGTDESSRLRGDGVIVNYSLLGIGSARDRNAVFGFDGASLTLDARKFSPVGTFQASGIVRQFSDVPNDFLPLDLAWTYANPDTLMQWRAGDFISGGLAWTRPIRMGGLQVQRNFALRPDLITQPLPSFSGSAVVPSTVDVFVGNTKTYSQDVPAGPFEISNIPVVSGDGTARIVVRDSAGHQTETSAPLAASSSLLRPGLFDFSADMGFGRRDYGIASYNFDSKPLLSLTGRYGYSLLSTFEGHAEFASDLANGGLGLAYAIPYCGTLEAATALSQHDSNFGALLYAAIRSTFLGTDVQMSTRRTVGRYADLGTVTAEDMNAYTSFGNPLGRFFVANPPLAIDQISLGLPLLRDDSRLGLAFMHIVNPDPETTSNVVSASYTKSVTPDVSVFATTFISIDQGQSNDAGAFIGLTTSFGEHGSLTATANYDQQQGMAYGAVYSKPLGQEPGSFGWQAQVSAGEGSQQQGSLAYRSGWSVVQARVGRFAGNVTGSAEIDGAAVYSDGGLFLANRIDDAFAVVDVGAPGVSVMLNNRRAATTGSDGRALVTDLRSYESSDITIDPSDLPASMVVTTARRHITPINGGGVNVKLDVSSTDDSAVIVFRTRAGTVLPVGSRGHLDSQSDEFVVGYEGQAYVNNLRASNVATLRTPFGECQATFAFRRGQEVQTVIDPAVCE